MYGRTCGECNDTCRIFFVLKEKIIVTYGIKSISITV